MDTALNGTAQKEAVCSICKVQASLAGSAAGSGGRTGPEPISNKGFFAKLLKPLRDFGFGSKTFWEGGVGLFIFAGIGENASSMMMWNTAATMCNSTGACAACL